MPKYYRHNSIGKYRWYFAKLQRESKGSGSVIFILVNDPMFVFNNKTNMFWAALQGISESRLNQYITIMIYMSHYSFTLMALLIIYWINACPNEEQGISNATLCIQTFRASATASKFIVIVLVNKHFLKVIPNLYWVIQFE